MKCHCRPVEKKASLFGRILRIVAIGRDGPCLNRAIDTAIMTGRQFEDSISHDEDSELSRLYAEAPNSFIPISYHLRQILLVAGDISYRTDGLFDVAAAGSDGTGHWTDIDLSCGGHVRLRKRTKIALGGLSKGYVVDLIVKALQECGVGAALVDLGGCIRAYGANEWRVDYSPSPEQSLGFGGEEGFSSNEKAVVPVILRSGALAGFGPYFGMSKLIDFEKSEVVSPYDWGGDNLLVRAPIAAAADALTKVAALGGNSSRQILGLFGASSMRFPASQGAEVASRNENLSSKQ